MRTLDASWLQTFPFSFSSNSSRVTPISINNINNSVEKLDSKSAYEQGGLERRTTFSHFSVVFFDAIHQSFTFQVLHGQDTFSAIFRYRQGNTHVVFPEIVRTQAFSVCF